MKAAHDPFILVISGPAGSGKTTLCDRLLEDFPEQIQRMVTTTSRDPRPGEQEGVDYHFLKPAEFKQFIDDGAFIEWARVHGRYYGSQRRHIEELLASGKDVLMNVDVQGAKTFSAEPRFKGRLHTVFIRPKSLEQIRERLNIRGADDHAEIEKRLNSAKNELKSAELFDFEILSGSKAEDYASLRRIYTALRN